MQRQVTVTFTCEVQESSVRYYTSEKSEEDYEGKLQGTTAEERMASAYQFDLDNGTVDLDELFYADTIKVEGVKIVK